MAAVVRGTPMLLPRHLMSIFAHSGWYSLHRQGPFFLYLSVSEFQALGNHHVVLFENLQYSVTKICPQSDNVCLQEINTRDRPLKRSIRSVDLPSRNCFRPERLPHPVLPDVEDVSLQADAEVMDVSVRADFDGTTAQDTWVNLTTDFSSVTQIETEGPKSTTICTLNLTKP